MKSPLHEYQKRGIEWLRAHDRAAMWWEMGTGKSRTVLETLEPKHLPVLIVAPKRVAEMTWPEQRDLWRPDLSIALAVGGPLRRAEAAAQGADLTVVSRDNLRDPWIAKTNWSTIVLDEASSFKSPTSVRARMMKKPCARARHVWELTGTPAPNGYMDIFSQIRLLDGGVRLGRTIGGYRGRYFTEGRRITGGKVVGWDLRDHAKENIHKLLKDIVLSQEALIRPPVTLNDIKIRLPNVALQIYEDMKEELIANLALVGGLDVVAANAAVATSKLRQISAGFVYDEGVTTRIHDEKYSACLEIIEGTGAPIMIFYEFKEEKRRLMELPGARDGSDLKALLGWQTGSVQVLVCHPASVGHGLNLQRSDASIVWTSLNWGLENYQQANARLVRQGQATHVIIHRLLATPIDYAIAERLDGKASVQDALKRVFASGVAQKKSLR